VIDGFELVVLNFNLASWTKLTKREKWHKLVLSRRYYEPIFARLKSPIVILKISGKYSFLQRKFRKDMENKKKHCVREKIFIDVDLKKKIKL